MPNPTRFKGPPPRPNNGIPLPVVDILVHQIGVDEQTLSLKDTLGGLGADELDLVEIAIALDKLYKIDLGDELLDVWPTAPLSRVLLDVKRAAAKAGHGNNRIRS